MTLLPLYLNLNATAPVRLAALRQASEKRNAEYAKHGAGCASRSWRDVRYGNLTSHDFALDQGYNGAVPVWYAFSKQFRRETDAHDVLKLRYTGYYTDTDGRETAVGIVAYLGRSRWIAGYRLTMNDERVYFPGIYENADDAARAADEHARVLAESEREYCERAEAARALQDRIDAACERIRELCAMRNMPRFPNARNELRERIQELCDLRDGRASDHADFI